MAKWFSVLLLSLSVSLHAQTLKTQPLKPERLVHGNVITSAHDPKLHITLPKPVKYLGSDRWLMFGVADCEIHLFAEVDSNKTVQHLYWVQFEGYVPDKPDLKYDYSSNPVRSINGLDFYTRARFGATDDPVKPGSDSEHVRQILQSSGYKMPPSMMNVRFSHLLDNQRREVMVIYAENTAPAGIDWKDLMPGGKAESRWPAIQQSLIERATNRITFAQ